MCRLFIALRVRRLVWSMLIALAAAPLVATPQVVTPPEAVDLGTANKSQASSTAPAKLSPRVRYPVSLNKRRELERADWFFLQRAYPLTTVPDGAQERAWRQIRKRSSNHALDGAVRSYGA